MLKISPFTYGLEVNQVYDNGTTFSPAVLDITEDDLRAKFTQGKILLLNTLFWNTSHLPPIMWTLQMKTYIIYLNVLKPFFLSGLADVASVSLSIGYPTMASAPHSIINGFKDLLAIAAATEITFPEAEQVCLKYILSNFETS